jgi:outer membrane protein insertion porin family
MRCAVVLLVSLLGVGVPGVQAQDPLALSNASTQVSDVAFKFTTTQTFDTDRLKLQIATQGPSFLDNLKDAVPLLSGRDYAFDPVELQRDVVRLRQFYARNGFPDASVDYPASQFNASTNRIRIIFTIDEGTPVTIRSLDFTLTEPLPPDLAERWETMKVRLKDATGRRFTDFERLSIENQVLSMLQDRGFAFASVTADVKVDEQEFTADLDFEVSPGPYGKFGEIIIEGNESVSRRTVLRELPFREGDEFSRRRLITGQQQIFGLNLFRLALAEVPDQEPDSLVTVRYRLRESKLRYVSAQTGFARESGLSVETEFRHRNFLGNARQFSAGASSRTGLLAATGTGRKPVRSFTSNLSLRQPWLGWTRLSGGLSPFFSWLDEPNQDTRFYEFGLTSSLVLEVLPFRNLTAQHTFSRAVPLTSTGLGNRFGVYNRSILSVGMGFGWLNDFLVPRRGWFVRPSFELGGLVGGSAVQYAKAAVDATAYVPVTRRTSVILSLTTGWLAPFKDSRDQLDPQNEFRFDAIRFYAGGASDIRGWALNALGPQVAVADSVTVDADGTPHAENARFEAIGGRSKVSFRSELRFPVPGLGDSWRGAVFLDGGAISSERVTDANGAQVFTAAGIAEFRDRRFVSLSDFRFGAGTGIRYRTPVGMLRLDVAYKLNPAEADLRRPEDIVLYEQGFRSDPPEDRFLRRLNVHVSIDRAF